jgi:hypothetical protein
MSSIALYQLPLGAAVVSALRSWIGWQVASNHPRRDSASRIFNSSSEAMLFTPSGIIGLSSAISRSFSGARRESAAVLGAYVHFPRRPKALAIPPDEGFGLNDRQNLSPRQTPWRQHQGFKRVATFARRGVIPFRGAVAQSYQSVTARSAYLRGDAVSNRVPELSSEVREMSNRKCYKYAVGGFP